MLGHHFTALSPGSWAEQKKETSSAHSFPSSEHLWGLWTPTTKPPRAGLRCPLCPWSCLEEALGGTSVFSQPHPCCVLHKGVRLPWAGGPKLLDRDLRSQESVWHPGQISPRPRDTSPYRGQGLRWSCLPLLCRAICRTRLQRPDQGCPPWSPLWC